MKKYKSFALAIGIILQFVLIGCTSNMSNEGSDVNSSELSYEEVEQEEEEQQSLEQEEAKQQSLDGTTWSYEQNEDDLTHEVTSIDANIISTNRVKIDSYGNTARLCISLRYSTDFLSHPSTAVMLSFVDDKELCRFSDFQGSGFLAVFDDGDVDDTWSLIDMTKSRSALMMYMPSKVAPFVNKLKTSKHARIQVNLENVGKNTFDFNIAGLKWDFEN